MFPIAIFFDLDDTIISYDGASELAWQKACNFFTTTQNCCFDSDMLLNTIKQVRKWYWGDVERHRIGRMDIIQARRDIVKMALGNLDYLDEESAIEMADEYSKLQNELISLFPNSIETLNMLKENGIRMALITNGSKAKQREKINRFCLSNYFEICFIEEEIGFGKPDIRVFQLALSKMELEAEDVWMVGDNLMWDIQAPQKLGIYSIWNDYKKEGLPTDSIIVPDRIIHSISELLV
ncbi:MAG: HAD family hydrolase [Ignavibacteriales bacterium]